MDLSIPVQKQEQVVPSSPVPSPVEPLPSIPIAEELQQPPEYQALNARPRSVTPQQVEPEESPRSRTTAVEQTVPNQNTPDTTLQRRKASTTLTQAPSPQHVISMKRYGIILDTYSFLLQIPYSASSESLPSSRRASTASFSSLQNADYCIPEYSLEAVKEFKCPVQ